MRSIVRRSRDRRIVHSNDAKRAVLMDDGLPIDARRARRLHERAATREHDDFLAREVSRRMLERLASIKHASRSLIDLGCGSGADAAALKERFDGTRYAGVDHAEVVLRDAQARHRAPRAWTRWLGREPRLDWIAADFGALPFGARTFDALWSNLAIHWSAEPHRVLREWSRVADVGALVSFSAFGPDTLSEVALAFDGIDAHPHVMPFTDLHDYGDMLVDAGFTAPVVDMERLVLTYADQASLWRDVRALGGLAASSRRSGLMSRASQARMSDRLRTTRDADGRYRLSFELIYAHAWKGEPKTTASGEAIVRFERRPG